MHQLYSPTFTKWVGVSPGTTTIQQLSGMGAPLSASYMPYGSEMEMRGKLGLRGSGLRWDLFALTLGMGFAGALGFALYKRKR